MKKLRRRARGNLRLVDPEERPETAPSAPLASPPPVPPPAAQTMAEVRERTREQFDAAVAARARARRLTECQFCETTLIVVGGRCEHCGAPENRARHPDAPPPPVRTGLCDNCGHLESLHRDRTALGRTWNGCQRGGCECPGFVDAPWMAGS